MHLKASYFSYLTSEGVSVLNENFEIFVLDESF